MIGNCPCENGLQRRLDQLVHKRGRGVVGAGKLPLRTSELLSVGVAEKTKCPVRCVRIYEGLKLKQALVDRSEFFRAHIPVVDAH